MKIAIICFPKIEEVQWQKPQFPIGLYKIREYCKAEYDVRILDERIEKDLDKTVERLIHTKEVMCLGVSTMTGTQIVNAKKISQRFQGKIPIVWGGVHPTICPESVINEEYVDYLIRGDGEEVFLELLRFLDGKTSVFPPVWSKKNRSGEVNTLHDLNRSNIDFRNLDIPSEYFIERDGFKKAFSLETSRGCPHGCKFCHNSVLRRYYRTVDTELILDSIDVLAERYMIDGIILQEDNFFLQIERAVRIISAFERKKLGWKANSRIDYFKNLVGDTTFMNRLVDSGCKVLQFGIESGSDRVLKLIGKKINLEDVVYINRRLASYDIRIRYNFIVGFPTETQEEIEQTLLFIERLQNDNGNMEPPLLNIYTPYPGTEIFKLAVANGFKEPKTLDEWAEVRWNTVSNMITDKRIREELFDLSNRYLENSLYLK